MTESNEPILKNKAALITGASQRLGAATARMLHAHGTNIVIHYNKSAEQANELIASLNKIRPGSATAVQADLNNDDEVANLAQAAEKAFQRLDILVNNASSFYPTPFGTGKHSDWNDLFNSNTKAPFFLSQHLQNALAKDQGCIINMVDIHAARPLKDFSIYSMAKSSLVTLTKSLAKELAPNVRVNGVAPGAILWPENIQEEEKEKVLQQIPLQRIGSPEDIAKTILFLTTSPYITGQIIAVDGGRSL